MSLSVESVTEGVITNLVENGVMEAATAQDALNARPVMMFLCRENPAPKEYSLPLQRIPVDAEMLVSLVPMSRFRDQDQCLHDSDFTA